METFAGCECTEVLQQLPRAGWDKPATFCLACLTCFHLGVTIGLTSGELSAWSPATLASASDRDSLVLDSLANGGIHFIFKPLSLLTREREASQILIQARGLSKLTHRCLGSSCPCTLFLPMLVGPEQHTPHQGPGRLKTSEDSQDENVAWHSVFVFTWTVGAMSQRICQPLYINTVISTTPVVLLDGEDAVWDRYGMIQSVDSFWLCKAKF